jgi:hypothetical protein
MCHSQRYIILLGNSMIVFLRIYVNESVQEICYIKREIVMFTQGHIEEGKAYGSHPDGSAHCLLKGVSSCGIYSNSRVCDLRPSGATNGAFERCDANHRVQRAE